MDEPEKLIAEDGCNFQLLYFTSSSISSDGRRLYGLSDENGHWNIFCMDLSDGSRRIVSDNREGFLSSYVYFDGSPHSGIGKASVSLSPAEDSSVYYLQGDDLMCISKDGRIRRLATIPEGMVTAFTHVSQDGKLLCVPVTEERALEYDRTKEGTGLDRRPDFSVDGRCQDENLSSFILVYDTSDGKLVRCVEVPRCWITHVQFNPHDPRMILFNNEWTRSDTGIRRMWLLMPDGSVRAVRSCGKGRSRRDWVCHEIWCPDGKRVVYHGGYDCGPAFVGICDVATGRTREIALDPDYRSYGHFNLVQGSMELLCDGYYYDRSRESKTSDAVRYDASDDVDFGSKDSRFISLVRPDWDAGKLEWIPLCEHATRWLDQDSHPHPISSPDGAHAYFTSRRGEYTGIYRTAIPR